MTEYCRFLWLVVVLVVCYSKFTDEFHFEDIYVPETCAESALTHDHLLLEYAVVYGNGTKVSEFSSPGQLFHYYLENAVSILHYSLIKTYPICLYRKAN